MTCSGGGLASPTEGQARRWLRELRLTWLGQPFGEDPVRTASGRISLDPTMYRPLLDALAVEDLGVDTIVSIVDGWALTDAVTAIAMLTAGGYAAPTLTGGVTDTAFAASRRLNEVLIDENRMGANHSTLVAPGIGAAVEADSVKMAAIGLLWAGADADVDVLAGLVFDELTGSGRMVREGGELVADPDAARAIVAKRVAAAVDKHHGVFVRLDISAAN